ncbi:hypothetical protein UCREL1_1752 [Eutypa lata UCREL1]|uniref:Uncharacterized protein n=1 Tax=Eutypa lata (strain UCR-EL1) TaxID=1287681 RepID=M7T3R1_EUTLA|nr:hypothetical protein UCREL1_1752 [Eutypa lata UCREL1]
MASVDTAFARGAPPRGQLRGDGGKLVSPVLIQTCGTAGRDHTVCLATFRWEDNEELQPQCERVQSLELTLRDARGVEHTIRSLEVPLKGDKFLQTWRARFLLRLMGPRPKAQNQVAIPAGGRRLQFRWADNFHLLGDNFRYVVGSGGAGRGGKVLRLRDSAGIWHELDFGLGAAPAERVGAWRASAIRQVMGGFCTVFGGKGFQINDSDKETIEDAIRTYGAHHDTSLSLEKHLLEIQERAVPRIYDAPLRPNICGSNFPDFLLSIISSGQYPSISDAFKELQWSGRRSSHFSRASRQQWMRRLFLSRTNQSAAAREGLSLAGYFHRVWRSYCDTFLDVSLVGFRRRIVQDAVIRSRIQEISQRFQQSQQ